MLPDNSTVKEMIGAFSVFGVGILGWWLATKRNQWTIGVMQDAIKTIGVRLQRLEDNRITEGQLLASIGATMRAIETGMSELSRQIRHIDDKLDGKADK